jgi:2-polyprenyl-3-methyl-5-hydroxy-6-metoxy-1,4-benzoquinol methylase
LNPALIFDCFSAYQKTAAMQAAVDIGLFTAIAAGHATVGQIAKATGASVKGVRVLCDYWTVNGLLTKTRGATGTTAPAGDAGSDRYELGPEAAKFLDRKSPAYFGDVLGFVNGPIAPFFKELTESVRRGGYRGAGTVETDYVGWVSFAEQMGAMMYPSAVGIAGILEGSGANESGKGSFKGRVLDVAAGHGYFGIVLAQRNPGVSVVALDWPRVLEVAKRHAGQMGVAERYSTIAGDAFEVDLKGPYEAVLLTNLLHHFDRGKCVELLKRLRKALRPGGKLVTLEFVPNEDRVSPPAQATFSLVMLATTGAGDAYTFAELEGMMKEAGFAKSELRDVEDSPQRVVVSE